MTWSTRSSGSWRGSCGVGTPLFTTLGIPSASGFAWALSIVGLVVVMRAAMIPLFVKQIHASRRMQLIQPEMQKIQAKYKDKKDPDSRQAMTQETMDLYKRTGTNPFSSCLPILLQSPFFFALFRVLNNLQKIADGTIDPIGPISRKLAGEAESSTFFGAQLSDKFIGVARPHRQDRHGHPHHPDVGQHVHHPAPADDEEHAGLRAGQPVRQAAEDAALPDADLLRHLRRELPDRCAALLADHQRVVDGPAVLRDPPDARAGFAGREGHAGAAPQEGQGRSRSSRSRAWTRREAAEDEAPKPTGGQRVQPTRNKKKKGTTGGAAKKQAPGGPTNRPQAPDRQLRVTTMTEQNNTVVDDTTEATDAVRRRSRPTQSTT